MQVVVLLGPLTIRVAMTVIVIVTVLVTVGKVLLGVVVRANYLARRLVSRLADDLPLVLHLGDLLVSLTRSVDALAFGH